ncbi:MAG: response regulator transcription factor [Pseudomonadota bacterium]
MKNKSILLVDDDVGFCELLADYLRGEEFSVHCEHNGDDGLARLKSEHIDVAILDVMMPGKSGLDVLRNMRTFSDTPTLMLTARGEDVDRIVGLEMGADDYVSKPCNPREIVARLRAILRRTGVTPQSDDEPDIVIGDFQLRPSERAVFVHEKEIELTSTEYEVLNVLARDAGHVVSKEKVSEQALKRKLGPYDRSIDMHVSRLRRKLGDYPDGGERIKTVRGTGYLYIKPREVSA